MKNLNTSIGSTLKEDQPLRLLLNLFFHHFNLKCNCCIQSIKHECFKLDIVDISGLYEHVEGLFNL